MTGIRKFEIQIGSAFLAFSLLFIGCNGGRTGGPGVDKVKITPAEKRKAKLLKSLDRKFENPDAHFELGQLYHSDGMWAEAEEHYKTALNFDPAHRDAQAARVKVLLDMGDTTMSKLLTDEYMNQASIDAEESLLLALAFQKQRLDEYTLACYQQALNLAPNSAKINRQIGRYYLSKNNKEQAVDYLRRSFQLDPNQPEVARELGRLGVAVRILRKTEKKTKKLDKIVEQSDKGTTP